MKGRDQSSNMHRFFIAAGVVAIYSMVIFSSASGAVTSVVHICCYSTDPMQYDPKCYDCVSMVYSNALMACVNMTDMPKNISYKAATCMEKNCQIQIPKISEVETMKMDGPWFEIFKLLLSRSKRSLFDNDVEGSDLTQTRQVVKEVSTYVDKEEPQTLSFIDTEYN